MKNKEALTRSGVIAEQNSLDDIYLIVARNIEHALMNTGAEPGKDYSILDLFQLAQPFVLHYVRKNDSPYVHPYKD